MKRLACALLLALTTLSCGGDETTYSYFVVDIKLDRATIDEDYVKRIVGCTLWVYYVPNAAESQQLEYGDLQCTPGTVRYDFGRAEWSTRLQKGGVKFVVLMHDLSNEVIATGTSAVENIVPKKEVTTSVTVTATKPPASTGDGGIPDGSAPDTRGADAPSEVRPPDGGPPDGGDGGLIGDGPLGG